MVSAAQENLLARNVAKYLMADQPEIKTEHLKTMLLDEPGVCLYLKTSLYESITQPLKRARRTPHAARRALSRGRGSPPRLRLAVD